MDIFKLFFNNDLRLDTTVERNGAQKDDTADRSLDDFMSPSPTFSKFYLTGTRLDEEQFGLNCLSNYLKLADALSLTFGDRKIYSVNGDFNSLKEAIQKVSVGHPMVVYKQPSAHKTALNPLVVDDDSNVGHFKEELREPLLEGQIIIYKEQAKDGFDLHIFSRENIYKQFFYPFKKLVDKDFRFFSVNSKRMRSERHFYFETWTLDRPPHGAEEVFAETEL